MRCILVVGVLLTLWLDCAHSWGSNNDRVLLSEVKSITLEKGKMTNGRRSSPVPQLSCMGGSAGCHAFQPAVVQCLNQGSDGYDAQWECKAHMDQDYRFGKIEVSCEGYEYPADPYILRGSCGLEYEIDLTESGRRGGGGHHHHDNSYDSHYSYNQGRTGTFGKIVQMVIAAAVIFAIYKFCCAGNRRVLREYDTGSGATTSGSAGTAGTGAAGGGGPGFFSGAAAGGLLGYLFGNRGGGYGRGYGYGGGYGGGSWSARPTYRSSGWSSGGGGWSSGTRRSGGGGGGSRTSSGFGGTSRR